MKVGEHLANIADLQAGVWKLVDLLRFVVERGDLRRRPVKRPFQLYQGLSG